MKRIPRGLRLLVAAAVVLLGAGAVVGWAFLRDEPPSPSPAAASLPLKVVTARPGLTAITAKALIAAGLDPDATPAVQWQLRRGQDPVPLLPVGQGKDLRLVFYAEKSANPYDPNQVYWLEAAPGGGKRPETRPVQTGAEVPAARAIVSNTLRLDWTTVYNSRLQSDDAGAAEALAFGQLATAGSDDRSAKWLGDPLYGGRELVLPVEVTDLAPGPAQLYLRLWANTTSPTANPDHHGQLWLNGQLVAEGTHEGQGYWSLSADLPDGLLKPGVNELRLVAPGDTGARVEQDHPDWLLVRYPQRLVASEGAVAFSAPAGAYRLAGFVRKDRVVLWDVTDPAAPVDLLGGAEARSTDAGELLFDDATATGQRSYAAAALASLPEPQAIAIPRPDDLRAATPADYIAIGPQDLLDPLQPLLAWRRQQGLTPLTVDAEAVYEQFGNGVRSPEAIRRFLRFVTESWPEPPRFVVLVGDASYDPYGFAGLSGPAANRLPTCLVETYFVGETASDHCFADLDDDLTPDLAVGRLPAQTPEQVATLVRKIIAYEQTPPDSPWLRRSLLVADDEAEFTQATQRIADEVLAPAGYELDTLSMADPVLAQPGAGRRHLLDAFDAGVALINYAGHGSPRWWAAELLSSEDAAGLRNRERLPIVTAMTCLSGFFHHPATEALSEALLWAEGGAVAAFMPSSEGVTGEQLPVALAFYRHLVDDRELTLGEAIQATKQELVESNTFSADMIRTFNLLGDPALRLPGKP